MTAPPRIRTSVALWAVTAAIILVIAALFLIEIHYRYVSALSDAERTTQSFADILAEHTARTFEAIDRTLLAAKSIRDDFNAGKFPTRASAEQALQTLQKSAPALLVIGWTNETGDIVASSFNSGLSNIAEFGHFKSQRDATARGLYISPPFRSKLSDQWIGAVSLRLDTADERFAGVVAASLDLAYFRRIYRSVQIGPQDSVALLRTDGTLLTRDPFVESAITRSYRQSKLFTERLAQSESGTFMTTSAVDGLDRIVGYRAVPGLSLVMVVSSSRDDALAGWYRHISTFGPLIAIQIAIVLFGAILLWRRTQQLMTHEALLEATLENMQQGLIVVDGDDRIAICNRRAIEILELPAAFMTSRPLSREVIAYQESKGEFDETPQYIREKVHPRLFEETANTYERKRPNGIVVEVQTVPFATGGTIRTYTDVTNTRQAEQQIRTSEQQFRLLAEHATDIIGRLNFSGTLLYVSPSCSAVLGYAPDDLVGTRVTDYIHPDDVKPTVVMFAALLKDVCSVAKIEYRFRHSDGRWIWLEANPTLVKDAAGDPLEFVDVVRDITDRKLIEAEAAAAREQAQEALASQSQFLATMSHELRTPLNSIFGFSEIVLDRNDLAPEVRRQIELIQTASDTLLTVVNDVLHFAKIEEGKLELTSVDFEVAKLIDDSLAIVRSSAVAKSLDLVVAIDKNVSSTLIGDDHRLRQILLNLLNNAIKFTHVGHVSLSVELIADAGKSGQQLRFSVNDSGIGISPDKLSRLFQRFSQVDSSTSREFGGSGLGLAISKGLVEAMGGQIGVESRSDEGSTFWFTLTLAAGSAVSAPKPVHAGRIPRSPAIRVLLVEDIDVNREIARLMLERLGYQVDAVNDGAEAVSTVEINDYDIVLMDIQMPVMDGITATKAIRGFSEPRGCIPIIAMTANVLPKQVESFMAAGMNGHIGKPFRRNDLVVAIERCLYPSPAPQVA
jgi:PAS domain S-box-containing protein